MERQQKGLFNLLSPAWPPALAHGLLRAPALQSVPAAVPVFIYSFCLKDSSSWKKSCCVLCFGAWLVFVFLVSLLSVSSSPLPYAIFSCSAVVKGVRDWPACWCTNRLVYLDLPPSPDGCVSRTESLPANLTVAFVSSRVLLKLLSHCSLIHHFLSLRVHLCTESFTKTFIAECCCAACAPMSFLN